MLSGNNLNCSTPFSCLFVLGILFLFNLAYSFILFIFFFFKSLNRHPWTKVFAYCFSHTCLKRWPLLCWEGPCDHTSVLANKTENIRPIIAKVSVKQQSTSKHQCLSNKVKKDDHQLRKLQKKYRTVDLQLCTGHIKTSVVHLFTTGLSQTSARFCLY